MTGNTGKAGKTGLKGRFSLSSRAFTLIEVLVAFGLLATGLIVVAGGFSRHLAALGLLNQTVAAHRIAQQRMVREAVVQELEVQFPDEPLVPAGFGAGWVQEPVTLTGPPVEGVAFQRALAKVFWSARGQSRSFELTVGRSVKKE